MKLEEQNNNLNAEDPQKGVLLETKPITKKPAEVRMGKGKGAPEYWAAVVRPGRILFEVDGISEDIAKLALSLGAAKLSIKSSFVKRLGV